MTPPCSPDAARFEAAFEAHHRRVLAYVLRRLPTEADAEDAVAETFAVAWRRIELLPDAAAALPWLLAIGRRVVANQNRGIARRLRLGLRLLAQPQTAIRIPDVHTPAHEALARLPGVDQELLCLLAWDGLTQAEAGVVLGISANAVAIRLYRARRRFTGELARIVEAEAKGSTAGRTSNQVEGRLPGRQSPEEHTP